MQAIATPAFAALGCHMICVEPNPDFYQLVGQTCKSYPNVELQNCSFEEWELEVDKFDAVLAASSFALSHSYENRETQAAILNELGQMAIESGHFKDRVSGNLVEVTYLVDQYLLRSDRPSMICTSSLPKLSLQVQRHSCIIYNGARSRY